MKTELCELFEKYKADKVDTICHDYSEDYFKLLNPYKEKYTNILEIGIGNIPLMDGHVGGGYIPGASIRAWRDFFPNATVYAIDILEDVLFEEERIKTYKADQGDSESLNNFIEQVKNDTKNPDFKFDFILDDGSHEVTHQIISIQTLNQHLKIGGIYIIEDIAPWCIEQLANEVFPGMEIIKDRRDFIIYKKIA
jgi:hypothetical protein